MQLFSMSSSDFLLERGDLHHDAQAASSEVHALRGELGPPVVAVPQRHQHRRRRGAPRVRSGETLAGIFGP